MKKYCPILIFLIFFIEFVNSQAFFENQASTLGLGISAGTSTYGSGISFYDFDGDGWDDVTLATENGQSLRFFKNNSGTTFTEVFFNITLTNAQNKQVLWVDFDNDGDKDLFTTSNDLGNKLYRNDGNSDFVDITSSSGLIATNTFTSGATWGDYNNDGFLDVFICNYDFNRDEPNYLYKNNGDGTFTDVSSASGISTNSDFSFCAAFFDYNNDGYQDIYIANDRSITTNVLYENNGDGTFTDVSEASNSNVNINSMTTTIGDYNSDGWFDIYVTNTTEGNVFLMNNGDETFTDIASTNGTIFNSVGWGSVFFDAENDTDLDLYVSGSPITGQPGNDGLLSAAFYENNGSGMYSIPETAGFADDNRSSFSNAVGDIDNDGLIDIVINNSEDFDMFVWKNLSTTTSNWLKVKLEGVLSNKDGVGSVIEISINGQKQYRYTACGEGYLSQNSGVEIFGLGNAATVDYVKVTWLSGQIDTINDVDVNQEIEIQEGLDTLSLNQSSYEFNVNVYPNPVKNTVFIESESEITNIKITNILGQVVFNKSGDIGFDFNHDTTPFSSGVFYITVTSNNKQKVLKIIKD